MTVSTVKYMPQAYLNYKRKSTVGWSIVNILLDFTGGTFSIAQLFIDAALQVRLVIGHDLKFNVMEGMCVRWSFGLISSLNECRAHGMV